MPRVVGCLRDIWAFPTSYIAGSRYVCTLEGLSLQPATAWQQPGIYAHRYSDTRFGNRRQYGYFPAYCRHPATLDPGQEARRVGDRAYCGPPLGLGPVFQPVFPANLSDVG